MSSSPFAFSFSGATTVTAQSSNDARAAELRRASDRYDECVKKAVWFDAPYQVAVKNMCASAFQDVVRRLSYK